MNIEIIGWGDTPTLPELAVTNDDVLCLIKRRHETLLLAAHHHHQVEEIKRWENEMAKIAKLTSAMITEKIGVVSRQYHWGKTSYQLGAEAAERAMESARANDPGFRAEKIAMVVYASSTSDNAYPGGDAHAHYCQEKLGLEHVEGVAPAGACCSATEAIAIAYRAMHWKPERFPYALVLSGEVVGSTGNAFEDEDATLWGDGGAAVVLKANPKGDPNTGILDYYSRVDARSSRDDGKYPKYLTTMSDGQGAAPYHRGRRLNNSMCGKGTQIFRAVVGEIPDDLLENFLIPNGYLELLQSEQSDLYPHNGNAHMTESFGEKLGVPPERIYHRVTDRANQSSASTLSSFAYYADAGRVTSGRIIWLATFASGLKWGLLPYRVP